MLIFEVRSADNVERWYRTGDLNLVKAVEGEQVTRLRDPHSGFLNFPLFVGKNWSHSYRNRELSSDVLRNARYEVEAYEKVTVKAGTLEAFKIEGRDQRSDRPYAIRLRFWYAPEVKAIVRFDGVAEPNLDPVRGFQFELVRYSPAP